MKKLIVGNWKMNLGLNDAKALIADVINIIYEKQAVLSKCDFVVCPSFLHIAAVRHARTSIAYINIGGQDCSSEDNGAHTGDISAAMLADSGCTYAILGHSERRQNHFETDELIADKAKRAHGSNLTAIICVGETAEEREQGQQDEVVTRQLEASLPPSSTEENTIIAYEPVWAIGTGKNASPEDIKAMHHLIRVQLSQRFTNVENMRILYGGSMKPENAGAILNTENVDGGLIGGASLDANSFIAIAQSV